jgi:hypothetical protein
MVESALCDDTEIEALRPKSPIRPGATGHGLGRGTEL